jgi:antitoxin HigA-1
MTAELAPVTPGELLLEEFLDPMGISQYRLAKEIGVPPQRISEIVHGKRSITADTDLRLCRFFGLSDGYWLRAQTLHDTEVAHQRLDSELQKITPWAGTAA